MTSVGFYPQYNAPPGCTPAPIECAGGAIGQSMIRIENLVKTFGAKRAVDGVSFSVERGEVLGFLGPNGSGKSTTMRMITGF